MRFSGLPQPVASAASATIAATATQARMAGI
jgi:hypothetical protein